MKTRKEAFFTLYPDKSEWDWLAFETNSIDNKSNKAGTEHGLRVYGRPVPAFDGKLLKALIVEITEQKKIEAAIVENKQFRKDLDGILQQIKNSPRTSRNRSLAITHLEDSVMRLGMDLKELGTVNPYPESKNPDNTIIEPTADGLKL